MIFSSKNINIELKFQLKFEYELTNFYNGRKSFYYPININVIDSKQINQ